MDNNLYAITTEMAQVEKAIYDTLDPETGEVNGDLTQIYKDLQIAQEEKLKGYVYVSIKIDNTDELIDKEIDRLKKIKEKNKKVRERIFQALTDNLEVGKKYDLGLHQIAWRKSEAVEIEDEEAFIRECYEEEASKRYVKEVITRKLDKTLIKQAIKDGRTFENAKLVERNNLQVK